MLLIILLCVLYFWKLSSLKTTHVHTITHNGFTCSTYIYAWGCYLFSQVLRQCFVLFMSRLKKTIRSQTQLVWTGLWTVALLLPVNDKKLEGVCSVSSFRLRFALCQCFQGATNKQTNRPVDLPRTCLQTAPRGCGRRVKVAAAASRRINPPWQLCSGRQPGDGQRVWTAGWGWSCVCLCSPGAPGPSGSLGLNMHNCKQETLFGRF